ncbi:hypothetical protein K461DRAFT_180047 [Myriangium duriaei CBS 260.36]|uniref:Uncharacterized protein n=1 Tax=Myriangium duriaei CBS 260.36 TaxID=1168546 RepID=A0A9P4ME30_9PEZI|nr:hypothetical protein K461DRAFT_180047 [Myriangium duriaei CBS 260.36]
MVRAAGTHSAVVAMGCDTWRWLKKKVEEREAWRVLELVLGCRCGVWLFENVRVEAVRQNRKRQKIGSD